jgi:hypothetical protein
MISLVLCVLMAIVCAPSALAASKVVVNSLGGAEAGAGGGAFSNPRGVAANQTGNGSVAAGTVYVVDSSNNRIQQFGPTGAFVRTWGWGVRDSEAEFQVCKVAAECKAGKSGSGLGQLASPRGIAVDQATGNIYVSDQSNFRVDVFTATGAFLGAFGWEVRVAGKAVALQFCSSATGCRTGSSGAKGGQFAAEVGNLAVAPAGSPNAGDVYVANKTERRIDEFKPTVEAGFVTGIAFVRSFGFDVETGGTTGFEICTVAANCKQGTGGGGLGQFALAKSPSDVAVGSDGSVFALDFGNKRIEEFSAAPSPLESGFAAAALAAAFGAGEPQSLAVDPSTAPYHLLIAGTRGVGGPVAIVELDRTGNEVATHGTALASTAATGLAVAQRSLGGNLYLAANAGEQRVYVLNETPIVEPVVAFTGTSALFKGEVVSNGVDVTWHFEYSTNGESWTRLPGQDVDAGIAAAKISVSREVAGLTGSQVYRVRLVQSRSAGGGTVASPEVSFTTAPAAPAVSPGVASHVSDSGASLVARLDPQNQATQYHFEYGTADCSTNPCTALPTAEAASGGLRQVTQSIDGLAPVTNYHFRLVAGNGSGVVVGPDRMFTSFVPGAKLPDDRAYEMVSPPDKYGMDIHNSHSVLAAVDGDSAIFASLGSFSGALSAPGLSYYRATRSAGGWLTEGISPPVSPLGEKLLRANLLVSTSDLSRILMTSFPSPPTAPGTQPTATDFYRRDLPDGPFENLTPLVPDPDRFVYEEESVFFAGADSAIDTVGIETEQQLTPDAPVAGSKAFIWGEGGLHFVAVLPDSSIAGGNSTIGGGNGAEAKHAISGDGTQVAFTAIPPGGAAGVYLRLNPARPQSPLSSGGSCEVAADACTVEASASRLLTPEAEKPAAFSGASMSGDKVLFKTTEGLVPGDGDGSNDLYLYEPTSKALRRISVDTNPADGIGAQVREVLAQSDDADYVYFAAEHELVPGQPETPGVSLYGWHDDGTPNGSVAYVATLNKVLDSNDWDEKIGIRRPKVQASPDGRYLVFTARTQLSSYENAGFAELYRYDALTGVTICVSCDPTGEAPTGDAALYPTGATATNGISPINGISENGFASHNVLDDGTVFFESKDSLTPDDSNGKADVYEWANDQISLLSSGAGDADSHFANASPSGNDVFFLTRDRLVGIDNDSNVDLYDARVGGGLAAQNPVSQAPCLEEACRAPLPAPPGEPQIGSASFSGPGNSPGRRRAGKRCADAKRGRGKGRCGKRHPIGKHRAVPRRRQAR